MYVIQYVLHLYKPPPMCDKTILENSEMLESLPDCYKNQQMCDKVVDNYTHILKFVIKLSILILLEYDLFLNAIKLKKCVIKLLIDVFCMWFFSWLVENSRNVWQSCLWRSFLMVYCPAKYETQRICDEAVDDCLAALKFVPDWFLRSKMLEKFDNALHNNDDVLFFNEDFNKATFFC